VDLREELKQGNRSILSEPLRKAIALRLEKKEQMMLFLNRRGYAGFISCRSCGEVLKCPHCDVSLIEHKGTPDNPTKRLICHYCGFVREAVSNCPACGSRYIGGFRAGTQQIEEVVRKTFPTLRTLRMDSDTTREKDSVHRILRTFAEGGADMLIGTQMIVKGHDFPGVTLVGVLAADMSLYSSHFSAAERTFQLLTQAAGRAGRGDTAGEVLIQTYKPEHYSIQAALKQDYQAFYEEEILYRQLGGYPPVEEMLAVYFLGREEADVEKAGQQLKAQILQLQSEPVRLIGPADCAVARVNDIYRKVLYLKQENADILLEIKEKLEPFARQLKEAYKVDIQFDYHMI
jgi:primosomal protein N' (replication factor Y)